MKTRLILRCAAAACILLGCTWTRFDDVTDNPPVERLDVPNGASNAGKSITTFPMATGNLALAVSADGRVFLYDLGSGIQPSRSPVMEQTCVGDAACMQSQQLAGIASSTLTNNLGCVAYGVGASEAGTAAVQGSVLLLCEDLQTHTLPAPDTFTTWIRGRTVSSTSAVAMATGRGGTPQTLVVSVPEAAIAWFYDGVDPTPIELPAPPDGDAAGQSLAVIRDDSSYWIASSSKTAEQRVWLYRVNADRTASLAGCVDGPARFGRLLATGNFDGDALDDLAVADDNSVVIIRGSSLTKSANSDTVCVPLEELERIGRAECTQLPDLDGCAGAPYAMSLAAGNLDASGPDELIVGAPNTSVRGEGSAGAAFVYAAGSDALRVVQGLYVSTASGGSWLGKSVAVAQLGGMDRVLAGSPGDNTVMVFYCNSLMPAGSKSDRCH